MKVLITGASGFVGSALARRLLNQGDQVRGTFRRSPPPEVPGVEWVRLEDLTDRAALREIVVGCEAVVHLAALAHQTGSAAEGRRLEFEKTNAEATGLIAEAAARCGARRILFLSSVAAVCSQSDVRVDEQTPPRPDSDYGRSKLRAEQLLQQELRDGATDWCILRPPLVYGPGNPGNMRRLMRLIESGLPLPLASVNNLRSFIFIDNLVDAAVTVLRHPRQIRRIFFLSDGSELSTPALIRMLASAADRPVRLWACPAGLLRMLGRAGDWIERLTSRSAGIDSYSVERLVGSVMINGAAFNTEFGWKAPVDWIEGMRMTSQAILSKA